MKTSDPYYEWLGIPPKDQPPNHYRLLGLELFEENRNVIDAAANRQMSFIKEYQAGPDSELSQKLLNELSAARLCLLSPPAKAAYDQQLRARLKAQAAPAPALPIPPALRWRNEPDPPPHAPLDGSISPSPLANAIPHPVATPVAARLAPASSNPMPAVTGRRPGILPRSKAGLGALAVAAGLLVATLAIVLALVLASPHRSEPTASVDAVTHGSPVLPANSEMPRAESRVAEPVMAAEPAAFSPPSEPSPAPARTAERDPSQLPPSPVISAATKATQTAPSQSPVVVVERLEPAPVPAQQPGVAPVIVPAAKLPKTTSPAPPPVETLEQADRRLQAAAEQASSSAEHQAVAGELLSLADKAILDSQTELAKRIVERALAAARKSESDDLVKQATLVWSELEQPLTDEVKDRARQRVGERDVSASAATEEKGQKD